MDEFVLNGIFWNHLVYPELASNELEDPSVVQAWIHDRLPGGEWPDYVACLAVDGLDTVAASERRETIRRIRDLLAAALPAGQRLVLGFAHTNALYFGGRLESDRQDLLDRLDAINKRLTGDLLLSSTIGLAFLPDTSLSGLQWAAQRAIVAQRQKVRLGPGRIYVFDPTLPDASLDLRLFWDLARRMQAVIRTGDLGGAEPVLQEIIDALFRKTYLPLSHLRPILQSQVIFMAQAATEGAADEEEVARRSEAYLTQIGTAYDYARLQAILAEAALEFAGLVNRNYHSHQNRLAAAVDEYIAGHFTDPEISLPGIAGQIGASPAHISRTYKRVKGIGIARSIQQRRVDAAQRLLLDRRTSITDVADATGFASVQSFGRVFHDITGMSPTAWRAKMDEPGAKSV